MTVAIEAAQSKMNSKTEISEQKVQGLLGIFNELSIFGQNLHISNMNIDAI